MNNLQKEEIKAGAILLIESLIWLLIYLVILSLLDVKKWQGVCLKRKAYRKQRRKR